MTTKWITGAALLWTCCGVSAADLYLRGGFNGWAIAHLLVKKSAQQYEARVTLSPGNHPFKVGSGDWSEEWTVAGDASVSIAPGSSYRMDKGAGNEDFLFVRQNADYLFRIDLTVPAAPVLTVKRLPAAPVAKTDPHARNRTRADLRFTTWEGKGETVRFSTPDPAAPLRQYVQSTSMQLRDPGPQFVKYAEMADLPVVRSGSLAFDALFAMSMAEMRQNAVAKISDGNYNGGAPVDCECFETGEKWHYVWTRDLSYAADLGLALLDPARVRNSLDFKLSTFRAPLRPPPQLAGSGDGLQIIQDTGSGGSWPVSTDRVSWAFGAEEALRSLALPERTAFAARALAALRNTIEADRIAVFDQASGLYMGEQSFLDWRDQSYAAWIVNDLASMSSAKALSTNVAHYKALTLAASLASGAQARRWQAWAADLKQAINTRLWLDDAQLYSSLTAAHFDGAAMHRFDWLGQSLAVITGVAEGDRARAVVANYPHGPMGAPVIFPQQRGMPVYHNRAIWPFVSAYGLKAAAAVGNASVADAAYQTLMRGAALNLSNMENLEWLSGQPLLLDEKNPKLSGPVINSRRQLWSVGAYLGMVVNNVFGFTPADAGVELKPFITARLRREVFGASRAITLRDLRHLGKRYTITITLPAVTKRAGYYRVKSITVNGAPSAAIVKPDAMQTANVIAITLGELVSDGMRMTRVSGHPYREQPTLFAPNDPHPAQLSGSRLTLPVVAGASINIYRNGTLAAPGITGTRWTDSAGTPACYAIEVQDRRTRLRSHHSRPVCTGAAIELPLDKPRWGAPGASLRTAVAVAQPGTYQVQLRYHNGANQINLGISGGVKWLAVQAADGSVAAQGVISLPHSAGPHALSTPLAARLGAGSYTLELSDFYNMSYLKANSTFSAAGGPGGPSNLFDIEGVRLQRVE